MHIFSYLGLKTKIEVALGIIAVILAFLIFFMFVSTQLLLERKEMAGGCKKVFYGPGAEGACGNDYYAVSIMDQDSVLQNPGEAPAVGYMICCRAER